MTMNTEIEEGLARLRERYRDPDTRRKARARLRAGAHRLYAILDGGEQKEKDNADEEEPRRRDD